MKKIFFSMLCTFLAFQAVALPVVSADAVNSSGNPPEVNTSKGLTDGSKAQADTQAGDNTDSATKPSNPTNSNGAWKLDSNYDENSATLVTNYAWDDDCATSGVQSSKTVDVLQFSVTFSILDKTDSSIKDTMDYMPHLGWWNSTTGEWVKSPTGAGWCNWTNTNNTTNKTKTVTYKVPLDTFKAGYNYVPYFEVSTSENVYGNTTQQYWTAYYNIDVETLDNSSSAIKYGAIPIKMGYAWGDTKSNGYSTLQFKFMPQTDTMNVVSGGVWVDNRSVGIKYGNTSQNGVVIPLDKQAVELSTGVDFDNLPATEVLNGAYALPTDVIHMEAVSRYDYNKRITMTCYNGTDPKQNYIDCVFKEDSYDQWVTNDYGKGLFDTYDLYLYVNNQKYNIQPVLEYSSATKYSQDYYYANQVFAWYDYYGSVSSSNTSSGGVPKDRETDVFVGFNNWQSGVDMKTYKLAIKPNAYAFTENKKSPNNTDSYICGQNNLYGSDSRPTNLDYGDTPVDLDASCGYGKINRDNPSYPNWNWYLKYDITTFAPTSDGTSIKVKGYSYIGELQDYDWDSDDLQAWIAFDIVDPEFSSFGNDWIAFPARMTHVAGQDMTKTNTWSSNPDCNADQYKKMKSTCNYYYRDVYIDMNIPTSIFQPGYTYKSYIFNRTDGADGKYAAEKKYVPMVIPFPSQFDSTIPGMDIYINPGVSGLNQRKMLEEQVLVQTDSAGSNVYYHNGNKVYFKKGSTYTINSPQTVMGSAYDPYLKVQGVIGEMNNWNCDGASTGYCFNPSSSTSNMKYGSSIYFAMPTTQPAEIKVDYDGSNAGNANMEEMHSYINSDTIDIKMSYSGNIPTDYPFQIDIYEWDEGYSSSLKVCSVSWTGPDTSIQLQNCNFNNPSGDGQTQISATFINKGNMSINGVPSGGAIQYMYSYKYWPSEETITVTPGTTTIDNVGNPIETIATKENNTSSNRAKYNYYEDLTLEGFLAFDNEALEYDPTKTISYKEDAPTLAPTDFIGGDTVYDEYICVNELDATLESDLEACEMSDGSNGYKVPLDKITYTNGNKIIYDKTNWYMESINGRMFTTNTDAEIDNVNNTLIATDNLYVPLDLDPDKQWILEYNLTDTFGYNKIKLDFNVESTNLLPTLGFNCEKYDYCTTYFETGSIDPYATYEQKYSIEANTSSNPIDPNVSWSEAYDFSDNGYTVDAFNQRYPYTPNSTFAGDGNYPIRVEVE